MTNEIIYMDADDENRTIIAGAGNLVDKDGYFVEDRVSVRSRLAVGETDSYEVTHMDASNNQVIGSIAGLVPFIERDRVDRALVESNQQKQAVPLIRPQSPIVGTGLEAEVAANSGQVIYAEEDGTVLSAAADEVVVSYPKRKTTYRPMHYVRSNEGTSIKTRIVTGKQIGRAHV